VLVPERSVGRRAAARKRGSNAGLVIQKVRQIR